MGILKFRLNRKNSSGSYDTIHYESSSNIILRPDSTTVENSLISLETLTTSHTSSISSHSSSISSLNSEMSSLKTSVSNGKAQIASAITGKGVSTSSSASFSTMANNIKKIESVSELDSQWLSRADNYYFHLNLANVTNDNRYDCCVCTKGGTIQAEGKNYNITDDLATRSGRGVVNTDISTSTFIVGERNNNVSGGVDSFANVSISPPTAKGLDAITTTSFVISIEVTNSARGTVRSKSFNKSSKTLTFTLRFTRYNDGYEWRSVDNTTQDHTFVVTFDDYPASFTSSTSNSTLTGQAGGVSIDWSKLQIS